MHEYLIQINHLKHKLENMGYQSFQVKDIIRDSIDSPLETASQEELMAVISSLEHQISFAEKCNRTR